MIKLKIIYMLRRWIGNKIKKCNKRHSETYGRSLWKTFIKVRAGKSSVFIYKSPPKGDRF